MGKNRWKISYKLLFHMNELFYFIHPYSYATSTSTLPYYLYLHAEDMMPKRKKIERAADHVVTVWSDFEFRF